ncbi:MAG: AAA family ATPase, partial [Lachnospiraceae bacterium]
MYKITSRLLIYGDMPSDSILMQLSGIFRDFDSGTASKEALVTRCFTQIKHLLQVGTDYGFDKNLWQNYLTYLLITQENPFTLTCEKVGANEGSVNYFAENDYQAFLQLFHFDFSEIEKELGIDCFSRISNYQAIGKKELMYNKNVSEKVQALSTQLQSAKDAH